MNPHFTLALCLLPFTTMLGGEVKFSVLVINGKHRSILRELVSAFEANNPTIKIKLLELDNKDYHEFMISKKFEKQDVVWWFAGYQLKEYAAKGYVEPINDLWKIEGLFDDFKSCTSSIDYNGSVFAIPISYYQWGIYYRQDIFAKYGLKAPKTWNEFEKVCDTLKSRGITPIVIGIQDNWTASAWFSYLDLRINGLDFHINLLRGKESFLNIKVRKVFDVWKKMLDKGYFNTSMNEIDWKGINAYMYNEQAAMTLIGNFMVNDIKPQFVDKIKFFRFPVIDKSVPLYEEAPTDVLFLTRSSTNKTEAKKFLAYWAKPDVLDKYNSAIQFLSTHKQAKPDQSYFTQSGAKVLMESRGFSQFWDRDTSKNMAEKGFVTLADFMRNPDIDKTMNELERYRKEYLPQ